MSLAAFSGAAYFCPRQKRACSCAGLLRIQKRLCWWLKKRNADFAFPHVTEVSVHPQWMWGRVCQDYRRTASELTAFSLLSPPSPTTHTCQSIPFPGRSCISFITRHYAVNWLGATSRSAKPPQQSRLLGSPAFPSSGRHRLGARHRRPSLISSEAAGHGPHAVTC